MPTLRYARCGGGDDADSLRRIDVRLKVFALLLAELGSLDEACGVLDEVRDQLQAERSRREAEEVQ
jgi:hypothetical protein